MADTFNALPRLDELVQAHGTAEDVQALRHVVVQVERLDKVARIAEDLDSEAAKALRDRVGWAHVGEHRRIARELRDAIGAAE